MARRHIQQAEIEESIQKSPFPAQIWFPGPPFFHKSVHSRIRAHPRTANSRRHRDLSALEERSQRATNQRDIFVSIHVASTPVNKKSSPSPHLYMPFVFGRGTTFALLGYHSAVPVCFDIAPSIDPPHQTWSRILPPLFKILSWFLERHENTRSDRLLLPVVSSLLYPRFRFNRPLMSPSIMDAAEISFLSFFFR